jgi:hypothetical protein
MTKSTAARRPVLKRSPQVGRLLRRTGAIARAAWQGCPEEGLPPVRRLRRPGWLGQVPISGDHTDPGEAHAGTAKVTDWRTAYTAHGGKDPVANEYFGLPEDLFDPDDDGALDRAADAIDRLPVVLLSGLFDGLENGLARTEAQYGDRDDRWSLIEAYVRLGLVPPANVLYLPHTPDPTRPDRLTAYLTAAYVRAACHQAAGQLRSDARMVWRLLSRPRTPVA